VLEGDGRDVQRQGTLRLHVREGRLGSPGEVPAGEIPQAQPGVIGDHRQVPERVAHLLDDARLVAEIGPRVALLLLGLAQQAARLAEEAEHGQVEAGALPSRPVRPDRPGLITV
jgi:hypothetical protein